MSLKEELKTIKNWEDKKGAYALALSTISFDQATIAPKKGKPYSNKVMALLAGEMYSISTDPKIEEIIIKLSKDKKLNKEDKRKVYLYKKDIDALKAIPKDEYVAFAQLTNDAQVVWEKAKATNNYKLFEPYLIKIIDTQKKFALYRNPNEKPYNTMLDDYEEGMTMEKYDKFFKLIKKELVPLIKKVAQKQNVVSDKCINGDFNVESQEKMMGILKKYLQFDPSWGYMSVSVHPFTNAFSKNDVRITTAYDTSNISSSIFSVVHEVGHAKVEHNIPERFANTPLAYISSGIHESQSRLYENYLGRTKHFWDKNYSKIQKLFPELKEYTQNDFVNAINVSRPSFVRTEADELTYPIHILVRYEIEKGLFDGTISTKNLNKTWNKKMKEHLGIDVPNDAQGILQDVHWSNGSFGYFPTYALGSAYGAQFMKAMRKDIDVDKCLSEGNIKKINDWLDSHIHKYANSIEPSKVVKLATKEDFNPNYYVKYLKDKYRKLYKIK